MLVAGMMGTTVNAAVTPIIKAFKIHRIRIWTSPTTLGVAVSNSFEWYSSDTGVMTLQEQDTSNTPDRPAFTCTSPPNSSAAWFIRSVTNVGGGATTGLGNIVAPIGSIIELDMSVWLSDVAFVNYGQGVTTAVLGQLYYGGLDGTGGSYPPIGLQTTT